MNELEQFASDMRVFATEVRALGYSSPGWNENPFIELSERMVRRAESAERLRSRDAG